jgi:hypothetical protein
MRPETVMKIPVGMPSRVVSSFGKPRPETI